MPKPKLSKFLWPGDVKKIRAGKYWICIDDKHIQPKGRLNCIDCCVEEGKIK